MALEVLASGEPADERTLVDRIRAGGPALVALSGGVDSAVVAALAHEALGPYAIAVTLTGPAVSRAEAERAAVVARAIGIEHHLVEANPLEVAEYRANPVDRCFFCRSVETRRLRAFGEARGIRQYLDGVHQDDLGEVRPGLRAMDEAGFRHPLALGGWTKLDVRRAARGRGLPNADQASEACLASRIAHGESIDEALLRRVEAAEASVLARGFRRVRVRVRSGGARIEVDPDELSRLLDPRIAAAVVAEVERHGFTPVTIDPLGYGANRGPAPGSP